jgi:hypothetical protein
VAINGELRVQLFGLGLLPIRVRLLVSSMDVASAAGLDWWNDPAERAAIRKPSSRRDRNGRRPATPRSNNRSRA